MSKIVPSKAWITILCLAWIDRDLLCSLYCSHFFPLLISSWPPCSQWGDNLKATFYASLFCSNNWILKILNVGKESENNSVSLCSPINTLENVENSYRGWTHMRALPPSYNWSLWTDRRRIFFREAPTTGLGEGTECQTHFIYLTSLSTPRRVIGCQKENHPKLSTSIPVKLCICGYLFLTLILRECQKKLCVPPNTEHPGTPVVSNVSWFQWTAPSTHQLHTGRQDIDMLELTWTSWTSW